MENSYAKAYTEVLEVLKYVPQNDVIKIPRELISTFIKNMDVNYEFNIDINKEFEEQVLLDKTKAILANIFKDYWATPQQIQEIELEEQNDRIKLEEEKKLKYNPDNLFENKKTEQNHKEDYNNNLPIEVKKHNFFTSIIDFFSHIKSFFSNKL